MVGKIERDREKDSEREAELERESGRTCRERGRVTERVVG